MTTPQQPTLHWGIGMTLKSPDGLTSVYFQPGEDAGQLEAEYEALEKYLGVDGAIRELWNTYSELAQPHDNERKAA